MIETVSSIVYHAPRYISLTGLTLSVVCCAVKFFQSLSAFLIYGFFTIAFAITTYREYSALNMLEINHQLEAHVNLLAGRVNEMSDANDHLEDNVNQLRQVRRNIHTETHRLHWIGLVIHQVAHRLAHSERRLRQTEERIHTLVHAAVGHLALNDTRDSAIVHRV